MPPQLKEENIKSLFRYYSAEEYNLNWPYLFTLPFWLQSWWNVFGGESELMLRSVWHEGKLIGVAPLRKKGKEAFFIGSADVCDYLDFIVQEREERNFFNTLIPGLRQEGIDKLILYAQRPEAAVFRLLARESIASEYRVNFEREDHAFEISIPKDWNSYLANLKKKQRHEVRRKLRRLENETENYSYRVIWGKKEIAQFLPRFLELFEQNPEKADFLTENMERFFKTLILEAADEGLARFGLLEVEGVTAAAILYFEYKKRVYLYNSGYSSDYASLSSGLLSKILSIKDSIEKEQSVYDFLKGREVYKSRLGGKAVPIYRVEIYL